VEKIVVEYLIDKEEDIFEKEGIDLK